MKAKTWIYRIAAIIVNGYLLGAAAGSFINIVELAGDIGVHGWHKWTAPLLVDGFVAMGKLLRSRALNEAAHRFGTWLMAIGGILSLTANIVHGHTLGERIFGGLLVAGYLLMERAAEVMGIAPEAREAEPAAVAAPKRKARARRCPQGCGCGKHRSRTAAQPVSPSLPSTLVVPATWTAARQLLAAAGAAPLSPAPYGA